LRFSLMRHRQTVWRYLPSIQVLFHGGAEQVEAGLQPGGSLGPDRCVRRECGRHLYPSLEFVVSVG
jgi:hypothetical protein